MSPEKDRRSVLVAVETRGLVSLMNDTKWRELISLVRTLPFLPAFQIKDILGSTPMPTSLDKDGWECGDWGEWLYPYYSIEWLRVRPRIVRHRGNYSSPEIQDIEHEFVQILHKVGVPHKKHWDFIEILGYAESTTNLER